MRAFAGYQEPGPLTTLKPPHAAFASGLPEDPEGICAAVRDLVIMPWDAPAAGIPERRLAEKDIRPASRLIEVLASRDPAPFHLPRPPATRVVGTCRHFATLSVALLRHRGIPARARCGFATYFQPGLNVDHWITEYWDERWIRIDPTILGGTQVPGPADLADGEFLSGGEAWTRFRAGADGMTFGVPGTTHAWGPAEIRGNAIRDLAALRKREMLPWDEWGRMTDSYEGGTGPDYDSLMDAIAAACASDDTDAIARMYASEDLAVPGVLLA
jgi:hypothetical protein